MSNQEKQIYRDLFDLKNKVERSGINARKNGDSHTFNLCLSIADDINQMIDELYVEGK